jgi:hypothetical protein
MAVAGRSTSSTFSGKLGERSQQANHISGPDDMSKATKVQFGLAIAALCHRKINLIETQLSKVNV